MEARADALVDIVSEIAPANVGQVFYQATVRGVIEKIEAGYAKVQRLLAPPKFAEVRECWIDATAVDPALRNLRTTWWRQHDPRNRLPAELGVIPDDDALADAIRRMRAQSFVQAQIESVREEALALNETAEVLEDLRKQIEERLESNPATSWDEAVRDLVEAEEVAAVQ
jgi:hypothetical protein